MRQLEAAVAAPSLEHRFGSQPEFSVGLEEELLLVDPRGQSLREEVEALLVRARPRVGRLASEIFAGEIELVTPVCRSVSEATLTLRNLAASVHGAGATVIGAGLHPAAEQDPARLCTSPRYLHVRSALGGLLRTPPAALHVHVGLSDPETAIRAANGIRRHLPLVHSLAANSPFWFGRDSGLASARVAILRSYPRYGIPRWFRDWEEFCRLATDLAHTAGVEDYTYFWWEVRPHPRLGTIEVRAPDAQLSLERTAAIAALIHALVRMEAEAPGVELRSREAIEESCYQATRYGLDAMLPDEFGRLRPARELALETARAAAPFAAELGCAEELQGVERIVREGNGADLQRRIHRRRGMAGLLEWLVAQRLGGER